MIKNSIQHAISNYKGKLAHEDFPAVHPEGEDEEIELQEPVPIEEEVIQTEEIVKACPMDISEKRKKWRKLDSYDRCNHSLINVVSHPHKNHCNDE